MIAAGGFDTPPHEAEVLITLDPPTAGAALVSLSGGKGEKIPSRLVTRNHEIAAGETPSLFYADASGQISATLISSDTMNSVVLHAGKKDSVQINFGWPYQSSWQSDPDKIIPGGRIEEKITLKWNDVPLDGHLIQFYVHKVTLEDDEGHVSVLAAGSRNAEAIIACASFKSPFRTINSKGETSCTLAIADRPEIKDISRSFADCSVCTTEDTGVNSDVPAEPLGTTTEYIQRLKRFHDLDTVWERVRADKQPAPLLHFADVLVREVRDNPWKQPFLSAYIATLYDMAEKPALARAWALGPARDPNDPNCIEARLILYRQPESREQGKPFELYGLLPDPSMDFAQVFPIGREADELVNLNAPPWSGFSYSQPSKLLQESSGAAGDAGLMYKAMNMWPEAIAALRAALGFEFERGRPKCASTWMALGDCFASQGKYYTATNYYYKSLASGQPLSDITHRIHDAEAALREQRSIVPPGPLPDVKKLETISQRFAETHLFDEAISAAIAASNAGGDETERLRTLHHQKGELMKKMLAATREYTVMRGITITQLNIDAELGY